MEEGEIQEQEGDEILEGIINTITQLEKDTRAKKTAPSPTKRTKTPSPKKKTKSPSPKPQRTPKKDREGVFKKPEVNPIRTKKSAPPSPRLSITRDRDRSTSRKRTSDSDNESSPKKVRTERSREREKTRHNSKTDFPDITERLKQFRNAPDSTGGGESDTVPVSPRRRSLDSVPRDTDPKAPLQKHSKESDL